MPVNAIDILLKNKDKNFVQRILNSSIFPVISNEDGSVSTHKMAAEIDENGEWLVFPTIVSLPDGRLLDLKDNRSALDFAKKTGEFINFGNNKDDAIPFAANGYKDWNKKAPLMGRQ